MKPSAPSPVNKGISTYKTNVSEFDFKDLRSGEFCDLTIIRQLENVQIPLFGMYEWEYAMYFPHDFLISSHFRWPECSFDLSSESFEFIVNFYL